jgi:hypothetical protein
MIEPVNGHLLIEPLEHEQFMSSTKGTYEEIGIVLAVDETEFIPKKGDKVYFDSWLAAKYPAGPDKFYWLVKWEDVRAIEHVEVSK